MRNIDIQTLTCNGETWSFKHQRSKLKAKSDLLVIFEKKKSVSIL